MGYKKEIKDRELLLSFYVFLFVCLFADSSVPAGVLRVNSRLFWSQSNKYVIQSKIAEFTDFYMAERQVLSHSIQKRRHNLRFLTENVSTNIQRILLICYSYESYANVEMKDHPIEAS